MLSIQQSLEGVERAHADWLKLPFKEAFSNKHKSLREAWCIMRMCKPLGLAGDLLYPAEELADVCLIAGDQNFDIQVIDSVVKLLKVR